jgi:hypothetical protein
MPRFAITTLLDVPAETDQAQLLAWAEEQAGDLEDATVVSISGGFQGHEFRVVGTTRGKPDDQWAKTVRAADADQAKAIVAEDDDQLVPVDATQTAPSLVPVEDTPPAPAS